ncbi:RWD domain-containing protein [Spironucleus salmonicida]|uniref:RWD domain-containing protein n=1 Tax=Spironucleus salmonicida TaxID=348837 RepID=V6LH62_9EUKA|nr:RWD domain-containing protein [Spironucleus salmonicida]|eukprot:EST43643.1 RWD domain-containing protein [Spironucleus salmonicida]
MNEIAEMESMALQSIFYETFDLYEEDSIKFTYESNFYNCKFDYNITFTPQYPNEPLIIEIQPVGLNDGLTKSLIHRLLSLQYQFLNDVQGYIYQLVSSVDEDNFVPEMSEDSEQSQEDQQVEINHGLMPGKPCTKEAYNEWFSLYVKEHQITLIEEDMWQHQIHPRLTGYEIWKEKESEQIIED